MFYKRTSALELLIILAIICLLARRPIAYGAGWIWFLVLDHPFVSVLVSAALLAATTLAFKLRGSINRHRRRRTVGAYSVDGRAMYQPTPSTRGACGDTGRYEGQLSAISGAQSVYRKRIFNDGETDVYHAIRRAIRETGRYDLFVHGQVSMGEFLACKPESAYHAINAKRVDFLVTDSFGYPLFVIEQRGGPGGSGSVRSEEDRDRNNVKREAMRRAGLSCIDVLGVEDAESKIRAMLEEYINKKGTAAGVRGA